MGGKPDPKPGAVMVAMDALNTRIAVLDSQVRAATAELEVARRLYDLVGHEVRTPLTVVLGVLATLDQVDVSEGERRRLQARALAHARRLREVVDDLMAGDSPTRSTLPRAELERVALAPLLREACVAIQGGRLVLDVNVAHLVATEPTRLSTIVSNLVDYAASHSSGRIDVVARVVDREIAITVADRGPGLQGRDPEPLFEPFSPGSDADHTDETGIGLYLARLLARSLGGDVTLRDGPGGGLVADLRLPQRRSEDPASARTPSRPSPTSSRPGAPSPAGRVTTGARR